jgi:hypothetical protein
VRNIAKPSKPTTADEAFHYDVHEFAFRHVHSILSIDPLKSNSPSNTPTVNNHPEYPRRINVHQITASTGNLPSNDTTVRQRPHQRKWTKCHEADRHEEHDEQDHFNDMHESTSCCAPNVKLSILLAPGS